ncbi:MAG: alpha/beta hydrolase family protein [Planctomycetota bacterium]
MQLHILFAATFLLAAASTQSGAASPTKQAPDLGPTRTTESGQSYHEIAAEASGDRTKLWVYLPKDAKPASSPCVVIAPAGTRMFHGLGLAAGDQDEHTPWVQAGFLVVAYEIVSRFDEGMPQAKVAENIQAFVAAKSGIENGKAAVSFAAALPQVDAKRIYAAGHSSAATLALQLTASDKRIAGVVAFAPVVRLGEHLGKELQKALNTIVKGSADKILKLSPHELTAKLRRPLFLFVAKDDDVVSTNQLATFATKLRTRNKRVLFQQAASGGHYQPMIETGIASAIDWIRGGMKAKPAPDAKK